MPDADERRRVRFRARLATRSGPELLLEFATLCEGSDADTLPVRSVAAVAVFVVFPRLARFLAFPGLRGAGALNSEGPDSGTAVPSE